MNVNGKTTTGTVTRAKNAKQNFGARGWLIIVLGWVCGFLGAGPKIDGLNTIYMGFTNLYGWTTAQMAMVATAASWIGFVGVWFFGWLANKKSAMPVLITGFLMGAASLVLWGYSVSLFQFWIAFCCFNIAMAAFSQIGLPALVANWYPTKKGLMQGWTSMGANLSTAFFVLMFNGIAAVVGFKFTFVVVAGMLVLSAILSAIFLRSNPEDCGCFPDNDPSISLEEVKRLKEEGELYRKTSPWTLKKLIMHKEAWKITFGFGFIMMITVGMLSQLIPSLMSKGFELNYSISMMTVAALLGLFASWLWGFLDTKYSTRTSALVLFIPIFGVLLMMALPWKWTAYPAVLFLGCFVGAGNNLQPSIMQSVYGRYDFPKVLALIIPFISIITNLGYSLIAVLAEKTGGYTVPYMVFFGFAVVAFILIFKIDQTCVGRNFLTDGQN